MTTYTHYGIEVKYSQIEDITFAEQMKKENVQCVALPILEHDVYECTKDGIKKYAVVEQVNWPDAYLENVYITSSIPVDLSWENLILDCKGQKSGEAPMALKTKAKVICEAAEDMALTEACKDRTDADFFTMPTIDPKVFRLALISLGYSLETILKMDHHDVSERFLKEMGAEI